MVSTDTVDRVIKHLQRNTELQNQDQNYIAAIARDLDLHRDTVAAALQWLEKHGLVERRSIQRGNVRRRKIVTLQFHPDAATERTAAGSAST